MKAGRNDPCPCGSGRKFKHCCGSLEPVEVLIQKATTDRVRGFASEAEAICDHVVRLAPQNPRALVLRGELYADRGRFEQAHELFERVRATHPGFSSVYLSIATHRRMTADDTSWLQSVKTLLATPQAPVDGMQLRFALGKYFDDIGSYDEAFSQYQQANELSKQFSGSYDENYFSSNIDDIIAQCDGSALPYASDTDEPVFVIGMPRSGTSLTEQILASHPSVAGAGEIVFWEHAFFRPSANVAKDYLERLHARAGRETAPAVTHPLRVVDKMPANFIYAGLIHAVFPRARFIHMQRHPLDVCLSVYRQSFAKVTAVGNDLHHLAHYYEQYLRVMAHWRKVLPTSVLLEVPYEALVQDPETWARRMVDFIGLPWDPRCLQFQQTDRPVITASRWQVRQGINAGSIGRWRKYERHLGPLRHLAPGGVT